MIGIYLLVSLFSQLSPQNIYAVIEPIAALQPIAPAELDVRFDQLNGIDIGSPVFVEGHRVGVVRDIESAVEDEFVVKLALSPAHGVALRRGVVGLISSPVSGSQEKPVSIVELFTPKTDGRPPLQVGEVIPGFSTHLQFWSAPDEAANAVLDRG